MSIIDIINDTITTNGTKDISGAKLNAVLKNLVQDYSGNTFYITPSNSSYIIDSRIGPKEVMKLEGGGVTILRTDFEKDPVDSNRLNLKNGQELSTDIEYLITVK